MEKVNPAAFFSYSRHDDRHDDGRLSKLCLLLANELQSQTGEPFEIFQDVKDIHIGQKWEKRLEESLDHTTFLIPIITPKFFKSPHCRGELERFLKREQKLGRSDLVLPVYYIPYSSLDQKDHAKIRDPLVREIATRQRQDWTKMRFEEPGSKQWREAVANLAKKICLTLFRQNRRQEFVGENRPTIRDTFEALQLKVVQLEKNVQTLISRFEKNEKKMDRFFNESLTKFQSDIEEANKIPVKFQRQMDAMAKKNNRAFEKLRGKVNALELSRSSGTGNNRNHTSHQRPGSPVRSWKKYLSRSREREKPHLKMNGPVIVANPHKKILARCLFWFLKWQKWLASSVIMVIIGTSLWYGLVKKADWFGGNQPNSPLEPESKVHIIENEPGGIVLPSWCSDEKEYSPDLPRWMDGIEYPWALLVSLRMGPTTFAREIVELAHALLNARKDILYALEHSDDETTVYLKNPIARGVSAFYLKCNLGPQKNRWLYSFLEGEPNQVDLHYLITLYIQILVKGTQFDGQFGRNTEKWIEALLASSWMFAPAIPPAVLENGGTYFEDSSLDPLSDEVGEQVARLLGIEKKQFKEELIVIAKRLSNKSGNNIVTLKGFQGEILAILCKEGELTPLGNWHQNNQQEKPDHAVMMLWLANFLGVEVSDGGVEPMITMLNSVKNQTPSTAVEKIKGLVNSFKW